ncbi:MAG: VWA domain-containing protein [Rubrivivax sp.]
MAGLPPVSGRGQGRLADNLMHFARLLRAAGLPVGTDRVQLALQALPLAGLASREDFRAVLLACWLDRIEHRELFDAAFDWFWQAPGQPAGLSLAAPAREQARAAERRLADALAAQGTAAIATPADAHRSAGAPGVDAHERLHRLDFDDMSADEWRQARRLLARLDLAFEPLRTRRMRRALRPGQPDGRATLQAMARHGGELWTLRWRQRRLQPAPLLLLADISGSMSRYSRMLLHLGHLLGQSKARVESFVFGTRLTRTTRLLKSRDPDLAVGQVVRAVQDWSGGTRIATSLHEFNRRWARRVLPGQATVLLVSDGLESGDTHELSFEMDRLHRSCRRLLWLNPLLRFARFEPRAGGIKAMLPHVDRFLPVHNLASLQQLVDVLAAPTPHRDPRPR